MRTIRTQAANVFAGSLVGLLMLKPLVDLLWSQHVVVGGRAFSPLHVVGVIVFVYFGLLALRLPRKPVYGGIFLIFIAINIVSASYGVLFSPRYDLIKFADVFLRVVDSYLVFHVAYGAGMKHDYSDHNRFLNAIVIGSSIALVINLFAIIFGFGGETVVERGAEDFTRAQGLYYDPGVLALFASFNLIFLAYVYKRIPRAKVIWKMLSLVMIVIDLYMIYISVSRAAIVLLVAFSLIYLTLAQRGVRRLATMAMFGAAAFVLLALLDVGLERFSARFQSEIQVLTEENDQDGSVSSSSSDRVSFGRYEALGSNRVRLWAIAFDRYLEGDTFELLLGSFYKSSPSHSDYFDVLTRNGAVGLLFYVGLLVTIWRRMLLLSVAKVPETERLVHVLGFTLITLYILYAFPFRPLSYTTTAWYMWAILGFSLARYTRMVTAARQARAKIKSGANARLTSPAIRGKTA